MPEKALIAILLILLTVLPANSAESTAMSQLTGPGEVTSSQLRVLFSEKTTIATSEDKDQVCLLDGQMICRSTSKERVFVWSPSLQARLFSDAVVLMQTQKEVCRLVVLKGKVVAKNRLDGSAIEMTPGAVLEVRHKAASSSNNAKSPGVTLFTTAKTETYLCPITSEVSQYTELCAISDSKVSKRDPIKSIRIVSAPIKMNYAVGTAALPLIRNTAMALDPYALSTRD